MSRFAAFVLVAATLPGTAFGQVVYSTGFDSDAGWTIAADEDTSSMFNWDYSALGIPPAPNGSDTIGLRLASNITDQGPGAAAISALSPMEFSGKYTVEFDFWLNYHTSAGTTEYGGGGVGMDAASATPLGAVSLMVNTEGDSATDYLLFNNGASLAVDSGAYTITSLDHADASNEPLRMMFPGSTPPESQNADFGQALVGNPDGTFGFGWHTMKIDADTDAGTATFSIDGFEFGTVTGDVAGAVSLTQWDRFGSVAGVPDLAFAVFDNLVVTQVPEPSSFALLLMGLLAFVRRRR